MAEEALVGGDADGGVCDLAAGGLAFDEGNYKQALNYWERILKLVAPDSPEAKFVQENIAEAKARLK